MTYQNLIVLLAAALPAAASIQGDSMRGAAVFEQYKCATCHSIGGAGGGSAPDLDKMPGKPFTPAALLAGLWNHAPAMGQAMETARVAAPKLTAQQSADLFTYIYLARFGGGPGDAARGRKTFVSKGCAECHNITSANASGGAAVMKWESLVDVIELSRQLWVHSPQMRKAAADRKMKIQEISAREMGDMMAYLKSLPQTKSLPAKFAPSSAETGETLFAAKGCAGCHQGASALPKPGTFGSAADFAASMWNHSAAMKQPMPLRPEEMTRLTGYLFSKQFEQPSGDASRGERLLQAKSCNGCHKAAPKASTPYEMISAVWVHGAAMKKASAENKAAWPKLSDAEMTDLLAVLRK
jgi:cytochrome c551/c552